MCVELGDGADATHEHPMESHRQRESFVSLVVRRLYVDEQCGGTVSALGNQLLSWTIIAATSQATGMPWHPPN